MSMKRSSSWLSSKIVYSNALEQNDTRLYMRILTSLFLLLAYSAASTPCSAFSASSTFVSNRRNRYKWPSKGAPSWHDGHPRKLKISQQSSLSFDSGSFEPFSFLDDASSPFNSNEILSFLPDETQVPPQSKQLFRKAAANFVHGKPLERITLKEIDKLLDDEYKCFDFPVRVGNTTLDISKSGDDTEQYMADVLSLSVMHAVPREVTQQLLDAIQTESLAAETARASFAVDGWNCVAFPKGLSVQLKKEFEMEEKPRRSLISLLRPRQWRIQEANERLQVASQAKAPMQKLESREEFLASMEAQLSSPTSNISRKTDDPLFFFPNSVPLHGISLKRLRRAINKKYAKLKQKGRAGFLSYCFFNFAFYTLGILWQWGKIAPVDPLGTSCSIFTVTFRKFGRVFASLYVGSQLFKIPKLFIAVALIPTSERVLAFWKKRLRVSETVATILSVCCLFVVWAGIISIPIFSEYAKLRRIVFMDEQLVQVYGLQPV